MLKAILLPFLEGHHLQWSSEYPLHRSECDQFGCYNKLSVDAILVSSKGSISAFACFWLDGTEFYS